MREWLVYDERIVVIVVTKLGSPNEFVDELFKVAGERQQKLMRAGR